MGLSIPLPGAGVGGGVEPGKSEWNLSSELQHERPEGGKWTVMGEACRVEMKRLPAGAGQPDSDHCCVAASHRPGDLRLAQDVVLTVPVSSVKWGRQV